MDMFVCVASIVFLSIIAFTSCTSDDIKHVLGESDDIPIRDNYHPFHYLADHPEHSMNDYVKFVERIVEKACCESQKGSNFHAIIYDENVQEYLRKHYFPGCILIAVTKKPKWKKVRRVLTKGQYFLAQSTLLEYTGGTKTSLPFKSPLSGIILADSMPPGHSLIDVSKQDTKKALLFALFFDYKYPPVRISGSFLTAPSSDVKYPDMKDPSDLYGLYIGMDSSEKEPVILTEHKHVTGDFLTDILQGDDQEAKQALTKRLRQLSAVLNPIGAEKYVCDALYFCKLFPKAKVLLPMAQVDEKGYFGTIKFVNMTTQSCGIFLPDEYYFETVDEHKKSRSLRRMRVMELCLVLEMVVDVGYRIRAHEKTHRVISFGYISKVPPKIKPLESTSMPDLQDYLKAFADVKTFSKDAKKIPDAKRAKNKKKKNKKARKQKNQEKKESSTKAVFLPKSEIDLRQIPVEIVQDDTSLHASEQGPFIIPKSKKNKQPKSYQKEIFNIETPLKQSTLKTRGPENLKNIELKQPVSNSSIDKTLFKEKWPMAKKRVVSNVAFSIAKTDSSPESTTQSPPSESEDQENLRTCSPVNEAKRVMIGSFKEDINMNEIQKELLRLIECPTDGNQRSTNSSVNKINEQHHTYQVVLKDGKWMNSFENEIISQISARLNLALNKKFGFPLTKAETEEAVMCALTESRHGVGMSAKITHKSADEAMHDINDRQAFIQFPNGLAAITFLINTNRAANKISVIDFDERLFSSKV